MRVFICPSPSDKKDLRDGLLSVIAEVKSWWNARDSETQNTTTECFLKEQHKAGQQILCKGRESEETITVLRRNILEPICLKSKTFLCPVIMWMTEPQQVKFAINFMMNYTNYCRDTKKLRRSISLILPDRTKRQYDMVSIYNVYRQIFCIKDVSLPVTLAGRPVEMHFLIIIMRFRGVACCLLQFTSTKYSSFWVNMLVFVFVMNTLWVNMLVFVFVMNTLIYLQY